MPKRVYADFHEDVNLKAVAGVAYEVLTTVMESCKKMGVSEKELRAGVIVKPAAIALLMIAGDLELGFQDNTELTQTRSIAAILLSQKWKAKEITSVPDFLLDLMDRVEDDHNRRN